MANKKGVSTSVILTIGIVILVAIVLLIGARFLAPAAAGTLGYALSDISLSIDAAYAAPEDIDMTIKSPWLAVNQLITSTDEICTAGLVQRCSKFTAVDRDIISKHSGESSMRLVKLYNETKKENEKLEVLDG